MPRAILEFTLPEEAVEHRLALSGAEIVAAVREFDDKLRANQKYSGDTMRPASEVRRLLAEILEERGLDWIYDV